MVSDKFDNKEGIICEYNHELAKEENLPPNINPKPCYKKAEYILRSPPGTKERYYCKEHYDGQCEVIAEMLR